jgi:hypothetical protein
MNDERSSDLNRRLRAGDPLAGETGLTPEEVRAMRRTVLTAVPEPRRRLLPALALAGAAAVALLIAVLAFQPGSGAIPSPRAPQTAALPAPLPPGAPMEAERQTTVAAQPLPGGETEKRKPHPRRHHHPSAAGTPSPNTALAALDPSPSGDGTAVREIQFSTPGGTRIIWTLAPGKTSF